jgi:hypothetical protein
LIANKPTSGHNHQYCIHLAIYCFQILEGDHIEL